MTPYLVHKLCPVTRSLFSAKIAPPALYRKNDRKIAYIKIKINKKIRNTTSCKLNNIAFDNEIESLGNQSCCKIISPAVERLISKFPLLQKRKTESFAER